MKLLSERYINDGKSIIDLNDLQLKTKKKVEQKVKAGIYKFEKKPCVVCDSEKFEMLSEKDRYGLYCPVVICKKCGLIQTNPRMNQESYNEFYDSEYRPLYVGADNPSHSFFNQQVNKGKNIFHWIEAHTNKKIKNKFVVEIGTGAGGILEYFKNKDNDVYGVDLGSEYISYGKSKGLNLEVGNVDKLSNLDKKPDIIIYSHVVEHILNPIEEFIKLRNLIKDTSLVYIEVPGVNNLLNSYDQNFLKLIQNAHVYHFTLITLKNCIEKAGFKLVHGNEKINSLFKLAKPQEKYKNNYKLVLNFLKNLEKNI